MQVYYEIVAAGTGKGKPLPAALTSSEMTRSIWGKNIKAAEKYNDPGRFTALLGYEWSSTTRETIFTALSSFATGRTR